MPDFTVEDEAFSQGHHIIAGIDEAGRGPWAGPVVAGAVILNRNDISDELMNGLDDSKKLSHKKREMLFPKLTKQARIGVGIATVDEIDYLNILGATLLSMQRALNNLGNPATDYALIDGNRMPELPCKAKTVIKGDSLSLSIAAASIIAKVTRDRIMTALSIDYPGYGWQNNAGYGTRQHIDALKSLGITEHHRKTFAPIRKILRPDST